MYNSDSQQELAQGWPENCAFVPGAMSKDVNGTSLMCEDKYLSKKAGRQAVSTAPVFIVTVMGSGAQAEVHKESVGCQATSAPPGAELVHFPKWVFSHFAN